MAKQLLPTARSRILVVGIVVAALVLGVVAARPMVVQWLNKSHGAETADKQNPPSSHELVRDAQGRPITPLTLRISEDAARTLGISSQAIVPAKPATEPRPLPPLEGDLSYQNDNLFPVRPRFAGEVVKFAEVPNEAAPPDGALPTEQRYKNWKPTRPIGFGDKVTKGQVLAVVWSKDLGDKKAALIDATIDLNRDRERLKELEKLYQEGAVSAATYYEARRTVEHAVSAVNAAERTLRIWKLSDQEINALKEEAKTIRVEKRDPEKEKNWARVDVLAPHDGTIVEKNTNLGDWVDPTNGNPMFRIADLNVLAAWLHPLEEYLPLLSRLAQQHNPGELYWKIHVPADPQQKVFEGPILRIAPSVDPTQRTLLVMGQVANPKGRLLVGESIIATIYVRPEKNLVIVPTTALNEARGQSVVFVQPDPNKLEFVQRRVAVAARFVDVVLIRSALNDEDKKASEKAAADGLQPIEPLLPETRVVTQGVPMLTVALRNLLTKEK